MTCTKCDRPAHAKNLCSTHYRADLRRRHAQKQPVRRYGDTVDHFDAQLLAKLAAKYKKVN